MVPPWLAITGPATERRRGSFGSALILQSYASRPTSSSRAFLERMELIPCQIIKIESQNPLEFPGLKQAGFIEPKVAEMSMIDPKGPRPQPKEMAVIRAHHARYKHNGEVSPVAAVIDDAFADVEAGVKFWKTISRNRQSRRGLSSEFLNRSGGIFAGSIAQILP